MIVTQAVLDLIQTLLVEIYNATAGIGLKRTQRVVAKNERTQEPLAPVNISRIIGPGINEPCLAKGELLHPAVKAQAVIDKKLHTIDTVLVGRAIHIIKRLDTETDPTPHRQGIGKRPVTQCQHLRG